MLHSGLVLSCLYQSYQADKAIRTKTVDTYGRKYIQKTTSDARAAINASVGSLPICPIQLFELTHICDLQVIAYQKEFVLVIEHNIAELAEAKYGPAVVHVLRPM